MVEYTTSKHIVQISGKSPKVIQIKETIDKLSEAQVNVLITGESGTGKEIVGRLIHAQSKRKNHPFVAVNCGAIPMDLLECELFGHEKGAFTGAITTRMGRFELAQGGTIFLDEIGDMPLAMQVKLLRVIQEKVIERIGSNKSIQIDARIIAATHRNLEEKIAQGTFREDLYYRLNVFPIEMPSLKERSEDIPELITDLIEKFKSEKGSDITLSHSALSSLQKCHWQGNVRELSNLLERLFVLYPNQVIDLAQLPEKYQVQTMNGHGDKYKQMTEIALLNKQNNQDIKLKEMLNHLEQQYIIEALDKTNGVVSHAAEKLGMRRTTLIEKMKKFNIVKSN